MLFFCNSFHLAIRFGDVIWLLLALLVVEVPVVLAERIVDCAAGPALGGVNSVLLAVAVGVGGCPAGGVSAAVGVGGCPAGGVSAASTIARASSTSR